MWCWSAFESCFIGEDPSNFKKYTFRAAVLGVIGTGGYLAALGGFGASAVATALHMSEGYATLLALSPLAPVPFVAGVGYAKDKGCCSSESDGYEQYQFATDHNADDTKAADSCEKGQSASAGYITGATLDRNRVASEPQPIPVART